MITNMVQYQKRVREWVETCFGEKIADDRVERNHRFLEEALELVQSAGCNKDEALRLVDYVYGRPEGEIYQEVGGTITTLCALCEANKIDLACAANDELDRIWDNVEKIRKKQAEKPKNSPLPQ